MGTCTNVNRPEAQQTQKAGGNPKSKNLPSRLSRESVGKENKDEKIKASGQISL